MRLENREGYTEERKCCTLDVERVVNDKDSIPHHGEVDWQVADVTALIVILRQTEKQEDKERVRNC